MPDEERITGIESNVEELASAVLGPPQSKFAGGGRDDAEGLVAKVDALIDKLQEVTNLLSNGGLKIRLPVGVWVAIIAALAGLGIQLIATLGS